MFQTLSEKLRDLRINKNYTQSYVAKYLNLTRQGYAHYEAGLRNPDYQTLLRLSQLYHIDIGELLNNSIIPNTSNTLHDNTTYNANNKDGINTTKNKTFQLTVDEKRLLQLFHKLSSTDRKIFLNQLEEKVKSDKSIS